MASAQVPDAWRRRAESRASADARGARRKLGQLRADAGASRRRAGSPAERQKWLKDADRRRARPIPLLARRQGRRRRSSTSTAGKIALRAQRRAGCSTRRRTSSCSPPRRRWRCSAPSIAGRRWSTPTRRSSGGELKGRALPEGPRRSDAGGRGSVALVSDLCAGGLRKVSGDLVVDDSFFDDVRVGPGFEQKQEDLPFRAPNGALSLNYNAVGVHVLPGAGDGAPARVVIDPQTPYFTVINEARTVAAGRTTLTVESRETRRPHRDHGARAHPRRRRRARCSCGAWRIPISTRPTRSASCARGAASRSRATSSRGATPTAARALSAHYSQPLGVAVRDVNKRSNNFMAEQILKTLGAETGGRPGTWQKGIDAVAGFLEQARDPRERLQDDQRLGPVRLESLLAGAAGDAVARRLQGLPLRRRLHRLAGAGRRRRHHRRIAWRAGWPSATCAPRPARSQGVSCLAGYAGAPGHAPLAFAIFMNDLTDAGATRARRRRIRSPKCWSRIFSR